MENRGNRRIALRWNLGKGVVRVGSRWNWRVLVLVMLKDRFLLLQYSYFFYSVLIFVAM